jgi:hypothetical protein
MKSLCHKPLYLAKRLFSFPTKRKENNTRNNIPRIRVIRENLINPGFEKDGFIF